MKNYIKAGITSILILYTSSLCAQQAKKPIEISLSTIKTDLKQNAINVGVSYLQSLDSLWEKQDFLLTGDHSIFLITPDISVQSGTNDAFSSITAKITGLTMFFKTTTVADQITPNSEKVFHTLPLSIGMETNSKFNIINGIAELGYVPWYQTAANTPGFLRKTKLGIFIQGGYKFKVDTTGQTAIGGEVDESKEAIEDKIFRAKGSFAIDTKSLFALSGVGIGLAGSADGWYDFVNSEIYYTLQAKVRFYLTQDEDKYFDFHYQKGSGAPNFNEGEQFGMGLTVTF